MTGFMRSLIGAAVASALWHPGHAVASVHRFQFEGLVTGLIGDDSDGTFGANFAAGDPVSGWFAFEGNSTPTDFLPGIQTVPARFEVNISGRLFAGPARYGIFDDVQGAADGWALSNSPHETGAYSMPPLGRLMPGTFFLQFLGMPSATWTAPGLVTDPHAYWQLYDPFYAPHGFRLDHPDGSWGGLYFSVTRVNAVPEPATAGWALAVALACSLLRRRAARPPAQRAGFADALRRLGIADQAVAAQSSGGATKPR